MFTKPIPRTEICAEALDPVFSHIKFDGVGTDYALKTLARILLGERASSETVTFRTRSGIGFQDAAHDHAVTICTALRAEQFADYDAAAKAADYVKDERLTVYFRSFKFALWSQRETKSTVILHENGSYQTRHAILSAFKWFVPWYFEGGQAVTDFEKLLLKTFTDPNGDQEFLRLASEYCRGKDYRDEILRRSLGDIETKYRRAEAERLQERITHLRNEIEAYQNSINGTLAEMRKLEIHRLGWLAEEGQQENRILDMFLRYRNLYLDKVDETGISYTVRAKATNVDTEMYKRCTQSEKSYVYEKSIESYEVTKRVLDSIFLEKKYGVYLFGKYELRFGSSFVLRKGEGNEQAVKAALPNPHVYYFGCAGSFAADLSDAMMNGSFEEGIEVTIAETANINFGDSAPVMQFARDLFQKQRGVCCIESPDGEMITPGELIERVKKEMENETAEADR